MAGLIWFCVGACSKKASGDGWAVIRVGNAGSGLAGALSPRCKKPGKAQLPCLTVPWRMGTKQGLRGGAAVSQSAALLRSCHDISRVFQVSSASPGCPQCPALCWHCPRAGRDSGLTQPLLILPALELSPSLVLAQSRAGAGSGDGFPGSLHCP